MDKTYMILFADKKGYTRNIFLKIEQTANRPNNPEDEEIIADYLNVNYGVESGVFEFREITIVKIDENYEVEV